MEQLSEILRRLERIEEKQDRYLQSLHGQAERTAVLETSLASVRGAIKLIITGVLAMGAYILKSFVESFKA